MQMIVESNLALAGAGFSVPVVHATALHSNGRGFKLTTLMKIMIAKYPGTCTDCGKPIERGTAIKYYGRNRGAAHSECYPASEQLAPCWICKAPDGKFRNLGAATPVWCDACFDLESAKTLHVGNVHFNSDNSSHEDRECGDLAYEDRCAEQCGPGL